MRPNSKWSSRIRAVVAMAAMLVCAATAAQIQIEPSAPPDTDSFALTRLVQEAVASASPSVANLQVRITVGARALEDALATPGDARPIVATFLTSTEFESAMGGRERTNITAIFSNPDPRDQVALAELLLGRSSIGVFDSPATHHLVERLGDRSVQRIAASPNQRIDTLLRAADSLDTIVALPDPGILNRSTINHVVRSLYQRRKVLIGYSETLARVGSLASVYVRPETVARRLVLVLEKYAESGAMPAPSFVEDIDVAVNERLARSLNIAVPETTRLVSGIRSRRN